MDCAPVWPGPDSPLGTRPRCRPFFLSRFRPFCSPVLRRRAVTTRGADADRRSRPTPTRPPVRGASRARRSRSARKRTKRTSGASAPTVPATSAGPRSGPSRFVLRARPRARGRSSGQARGPASARSRSTVREAHLARDRWTGPSPSFGRRHARALPRARSGPPSRPRRASERIRSPPGLSDPLHDPRILEGSRLP